MEITNNTDDDVFMSSDYEEDYKDDGSSTENHNDNEYRNDIPFMPLLDMIQNEDNNVTKKSKKQ